MRWAGLGHPVALAALAVLVVNDQALKAWWPGAVTGKLSDFAGMVVAPLLLLALADAFPLAARVRRRAPLVAVAVVAVGFAGIKSWAPATDACAEALAALRAPLRLAAAAILGVPYWREHLRITCDPSDLVALPAGLVALRVARARRKVATAREGASSPDSLGHGPDPTP